MKMARLKSVASRIVTLSCLFVYGGLGVSVLIFLAWCDTRSDQMLTAEAFHDLTAKA